MAVKGVKDVMNKAKVMTATATLVAGLGVASHVNADEVDFSTATQNSEAQANQVESNVTKANVDAAKANLDTANQAVSVQEQVVNDAATVADEAQSVYNQAQQSTNEAQNLVDQATPENIASAQDGVNLAQKQVSQADNAERVAENTVAQAQEAVNNQSEVVDSAQSDVSAAQSAVDAAQKDVNDKQAILDGTGQAEIIANRDKVQADVNLAQNQVAQAESDLTKSQEADANRQQVIDNAQQAVDEANQNVALTKSDLNAKTTQANQTQVIEDAKQADVAIAQKDVNDKQAILDGTGQKAILDEAEAAKNNEASKQANLTDAQEALQKAQEADANRQQSIDNAQKAVDEANQIVSTTKSDLDAKAAQAQQAEQALADAQSVYKTAKNDYKAINTITLSEDYIRLLKQSYTANTLKERQQALEELKLKNNDLKPEYVFKSNSNDDKHIVDLNNLSLNQLTELSLFASDLVNQIRQQVGSASTVVTDSSVGFAKKVTENYILDNWDMAKGHDASAVNNAAKYYGLSTSTEQWEKQGLQYYENWAGLSRNSQSTMSDLKADIYDAIYRFMFDGDEYDHASSIAGIRAANTTTVTYLGVGFTSLSTSHFDGVHFLLVGDNYVKNAQNNNFSTTVIENLKTPEKVTTTYNTAKADLEAKTATNNSAQSDLSAAQNSYNTAIAANTKAVLEAAQSDLAQAQAENSVAQAAKTATQTAYDNAVSNLSSASATLTQAQSVAIQTPTAKANLASAQATLKQAQENLVKAQKAVDDLSADIAVKQANLASAKQVLSTKQATLATKQATLTTEQNRLASLQNSLATAQANVLKAKENVMTANDNLAKAQAYLSSLQNAPALLAQAQQQEATAKANLLAALDTLEAELLKLKDLQVKQAATQAVYDTTSKAYQTILDAQEKQRLQDEYNAIIAQGKTPVAIVDETGKIVSYQAEDPQTTIQSSSAESTSVKAQVKPVEEVSVVTASALPMTGEHGSVLAVLFGCLITIWGLVGVRRKNN